MSTPVPEPVAQATDADVNGAVQHAADDANKHTPEPPVTAPPNGTVTDPTNGAESKDDLRDLVTDLANQVATLTNLVTKQTTPDEGAGQRLPWALRGKRDL